MNKLLERTLQLAGVLLEEEPKEDESVSDVDTEEKKPDEEKSSNSNEVSEFISSTYTELREKKWGFVDELFDKMAEEFGEDITNLIINNTPADDLDGAAGAADFTEKLDVIKKWYDAAKDGKEEKSEEKPESEEKDDGVDASDLDQPSTDDKPAEDDADLDKIMDKVIAK